MKNNLLAGALFMIAAEFVLALMAAQIKLVSQTLPTIEIVFFRNLFGLLFLLPWLMRQGLNQQLATRRLPLHMIRAASGVAAMFGFFHVLGALPLAEAVLVKLTAPFFIPIVAYYWLRESIGPITKIAIVVGFAGVILILRPGTETFQPVALIGVAAALSAAIAKTAIRKMSDTEPGPTIVFYFAFFSCLLSALPAAFFWQTPTQQEWLWLAGIGLSGMLGQLALTRSYQEAQAGQVGLYAYSSVVWASLIGWLFWQEHLLISTIAGSGLIFLAGTLNLKSSSFMKKGDMKTRSRGISTE